jgi:hypothetical protein
MPVISLQYCQRLPAFGFIKFRVARRVLCVAVMPGVKMAVEGRIIEAQHAGDPADQIVGEARGEGGPVHAFVHRGKHRNDRHAVQRHCREQQVPIRQA